MKNFASIERNDLLKFQQTGVLNISNTQDNNPKPLKGTVVSF